MDDRSSAATEQALRAVYGFIAPDELIEIGLKRATSAGSGWQSVFTGLDDLLAGGLAFVETSSRDGADAYIGACTVVGGPPERGRGGASVRGRAGALWVDLDCVAPGREGSTYFDTPETALAVLDTVLERVGLPGAADVVVQSGWGVQGWIRLAEPVDARVASRWTRALISEIKNGPECNGEKQIDRVWDVTRVLRFPGGGTFNWRAGHDEGDESPVSVWRLPIEGAPGVALDKVVTALGAADEAERERFVSGVGSTFSGSFGGFTNRATGVHDAPLLDMESIFDRVSWSAVLEPFGWTRVGGHGELGVPGEMDVWLRPGKRAQGSAGLRSAVVYGDAPAVLVVHSDSAETGLPGWWETRTRGGAEEGGSRRANTRWRAFMRLRALHERRLDYGGVGDENAAEQSIRAQALAVALGRGETSDWPPVIVQALQHDGDIVRSWIDQYKQKSSDAALAAAARISES